MNGGVPWAQFDVDEHLFLKGWHRTFKGGDCAIHCRYDLPL